MYKTSILFALMDSLVASNSDSYFPYFFLSESGSKADLTSGLNISL